MKVLEKSVAVVVGALARAVVRKYKPRIVGVTGSVGKTTTRNMIATVLEHRYRVWSPQKNFNNEFGLPLTILGLDSPRRSVLGWLGVFMHGLGLLLWRQRYPEVLVLEYGIDAPGDMAHLLHIATPTIGVITSIGLAHYEYFKTEAVVEREKGLLAEALGAGAVLVLNADNAIALRQRAKTKAQVLTYGTSEADVVVRGAGITVTAGKVSSPITVTASGEIITVPGVFLGTPQQLAAAAAVTVARHLGISLGDIATALTDIKPVPGRLQFIPAVNKGWLLDDSYNAGPDSMSEALAVLMAFPAAHTIVVLGDMLELGDKSVTSHEAIGQLVAKLQPNVLVVVGTLAATIADSAVAAGFAASNVHRFSDSEEAARFVPNLVAANSVVLVKGSQGVRMEKISKALLADPMKASVLLPRQSEAWLKR